MNELHTVLSSVEVAIKAHSVSGDFIPAPDNSENAGHNYLYVNCYFKKECETTREFFRDTFVTTARLLQRKNLDQDYISVVFSLYTIDGQTVVRLYRAVIWKSNLSEVTAVCNFEQILAKEEIY